MTEKIETDAPKIGRRRKGDGPAFPHEEVDRLLVHGEILEAEDGREMRVKYPSLRAVADRFGVAHSLIADFARKHNCVQRRKQTAARVKELADSKLIELRADALAVTRDDQIRAIDRFLTKFEEALEYGRVRFDNPADYNTMCRLKAYLLGDADSRQQVIGGFPTLEELQKRHAAMLAKIQQSTPAERGEVGGARAVGIDGMVQEANDGAGLESEKSEDTETVH